MATYDRFAGIDDNYLFPPQVRSAIANYPEVQDTINQRVASLATRLAALEYRSGGRNITALCSGVTSGSVLLSRVGPTVSVTLDSAEVPASGWQMIYILPKGFRPAIYIRKDLPYSTFGWQAAIFTTGSIYINGASGARKETLTFGTEDPPPSSPPGDPT